MASRARPRARAGGLEGTGPVVDARSAGGSGLLDQSYDAGGRSSSTAAKRSKRPKWHHRPRVQRVLAWLIAGYIRLVDRTGRWRIRYPEATAELVRSGRPFIGAFWHGRLMMMHPAWRRLLAELGKRQQRQPHVISSAHGDGQLIQLATGRFGVKTLWGSSRRGGVKVLREAKHALEAGDIVIMTPDGPRGPRMRAHAGIAYLASSTEVPVLQATFASRRGRIIGSWDRFLLALPFTGGIIAFDEPIDLSAEGDTEAGRAEIEARMIRFAEAIDEEEGMTPIRPDAPRA